MKTLRNIDLKSQRNSYIVAVAIALVIAAVLLGFYYVDLKPDPEGYMTIYLLDAHKEASNYPELLVSGVNSTFSVYVDVENHMVDSQSHIGIPQNCTVLVKVTQNMNPTFPVYGVEPKLTFNTIVPYEETWENTATITLNQSGNYMVIFELWITNDKTNEFQFFGDLTVLNIQVL